jgi:Zn-dependent peptidase ImmA (M78 family)
MRRGFKSWAEAEALNQRQKLRLLPNDHLPAKSLAEAYSIRILTPHNLPKALPEDLKQLTKVDPESWSAFSVSFRELGLIICNPSHSQKRFESDVMHEIAHRICGHRLSQIIKFTDTDLYLREYKEDEEIEATWLGGCLQLPRSALLWALKQGLTHNQISDRFIASNAMVTYRVNITGIERQIKAARGRESRGKTF